MTPEQKKAVEDDYVPFGYQWEAEALKLTKNNLVKMCARIGIERNKLMEERGGLVSKEEMFEFMEWMADNIIGSGVERHTFELVLQEGVSKDYGVAALFEIFKNKDK